MKDVFILKKCLIFFGDSVWSITRVFKFENIVDVY